MTGIHNFYAKFYEVVKRGQGGSQWQMKYRSIVYLYWQMSSGSIWLTELQKNEYYKALESFQKNETPGNDGLTVEFYFSFWYLVGKCLVNALHLHFPQAKGEP